MLKIAAALFHTPLSGLRALVHLVQDETVEFSPTRLSAAEKRTLIERYVRGRVSNFLGRGFTGQILSAIVTNHSVMLNVKELETDHPKTFALRVQFADIVSACHHSHGDKLQLTVSGEEPFVLWLQPFGWEHHSRVVRWNQVFTPADEPERQAHAG